MNLKKLLAIVASVMLLMSLPVAASAADISTDTAPAAVTDCATARLAQLEARVKDLLSAGIITQTQADALMARVKACVANCDGTGCDNRGLCNGTGCDNQGLCNGTGCDNQSLCNGTGCDNQGLCNGTGCDNQSLCNGTGCDNQGLCNGTGCDNQGVCDGTGAGIYNGNNSHCDTPARSGHHSKHAH